MTLTILHIIDLLLWAIITPSIAYVAFFAFISLWGRRKPTATKENTPHRFVVFYPAYREDRVIRNSIETFLRQDYPANLHQLVVISDHMKPETNQWLTQQPLLLCQPKFEKSSKAKALQYAVSQLNESFDYAVILDADNVVAPDFLTRLNLLCTEGYHAIQCHRTAKNNDNDIAALDGASEEINNTIFRRAHNQVGLSSALIGSGMCFSYQWFKENVGHLATAGEDRELEALLLRQHIHVHYAEDIYVMDEKVSSGDNFQRQRLRWMTAQLQCLLAMLPYLPHAIVSGNIDYIDKTIQQALIPRSVLLVFTSFIATLLSVAVPSWCMKWWLILAVLILSLFIAIPKSMRTLVLFGKVLLIPQLVWRMVKNITHIDRNNRDFIHTEHSS